MKEEVQQFRCTYLPLKINKIIWKLKLGHKNKSSAQSVKTAIWKCHSGDDTGDKARYRVHKLEFEYQPLIGV
jgi:hypothetical protein